MNVSFRQDTRRGSLTTVLGQDVLVLLRFNGTDRMNGLFEYRVEALSTERDIDFDALIGTHATVELHSQTGATSFDGIVTETEWAGAGDNGHKYVLTLKPWFWLAGLRRNQRIFHNQTVVDIIENVLGAYSHLGSPAHELRLTQDYPELEYTVQYNESDLNFVCRLMERFGISYHFTHKPGDHCLVLTDSVESHEPLPGDSRPYKGYDGHHVADEEHFWDWRNKRHVTTGAMRLKDYYFESPTAAMEVERVGDAQHAEGQLESYDYPGDYRERGHGQSVVELRTLQERTRDKRVYAEGDVTSLLSGLLVTLDGDAIPKATGETFLCLKASHSYVAEGYGSGTESDGYSYSGQYTLMPQSAPMVPPIVTRQPRIQGPQTAMVVGDGEIDCDEYGRVLVHFHWDLEKAYSMRCRVMQHSANGKYGGMVIPRIGMEAVVEFLEGDPDKPMVTGCVFNGKTDRPYVLPGHKTKHVIRADTHQGSGFNEISFEAQSGRENMQIHAQKDQTTRVLNDQSNNVGSNKIEQVGMNSSTAITANRMERVGANKSTTVGGGGPLGLLQMLMPLVQAGGKFLKKNSNRASAGAGVGGFAGIVAGVSDMPNELAAIQQKAGFATSAGHRDEGGAAQLAEASTMGKLLSNIMPSSGTMNTTVERYHKLTVGQGASEQIGMAKNTLVGNVMSTSVGKLAVTKVGEDYELESKKSIFNRTKKHVLHAKEKFVIGGPGGTIIIDSSGVTIKTKHLKVKSPKVDFTSGSPDQVDALNSDKPFVQECKGK
jgi:type VI secretion system secreted protein VgrG